MPKNTTQMTPMMQQYHAIKASHQEYILFYRMGDFYECFFEDATITAAALDIALTHRGKQEGSQIPMCGVPYHAYERYLHELIKQGYKVAICEQMESPEEAKKRGYKAVVKREVVRIVTPGTLTEEGLLEAKNHNYLVALTQTSQSFGLAWVDISTGAFFTSPTNETALLSDIVRLQPTEILLPDTALTHPALADIWKEYRSILTPHVATFFDSVRAERRLKTHFNVNSLDGFGTFSRAEIAASGALLEYLELTQKQHMPRLAAPKRFEIQHYMRIDAATRKNLELTQSLAGEKKGSLLQVIDKTITSTGGRLLHHYISHPLCHASGVQERLSRTQYFVTHPDMRNRLQDCLRHIPDMERALSRICIQRGGPRDILAIREALQGAIAMRNLLAHCYDTLPNSLQSLYSTLQGDDALTEYLQHAFKDEVGMLARDGNFIRDGFDATLDEQRNIRANSKTLIEQLRESYRQETGVNSLKIAQNNVIGFYIEVTKQHTNKMPEYFHHKQTLGNAMRYTSAQLQELESAILGADERILSFELELFGHIVTRIITAADNIALVAQTIATLDVATSFAQLAEEQRYVCPTVDDSTTFHIQGGRHPVVEYHLTGEAFATNNTDLSSYQRLWLLTGPNMAGKSTFLRQNALIALLAQMGSFVPADSAHIGTVDRLFSRVGASDDLAHGRSTFMVEMVETATILNNATEKSLVILDEIGRGTATYDGLSIAWACVEHIHNHNQCRALFATHYHELTTLASSLAALKLVCMHVKEWEGKVVFMHEVVEGSADRSYGIYVAKLAGLPQGVISRAEDILTKLQHSETGNAITKLADDLPLFAPSANENTPSAVETLLADVDADTISPKEALELIYQLKQQVSNL